MTLSLRRPTRALLARLVESPDLASIVQALPPATFASTVQEIGLADAAELVAVATTEQLVAAFDETLFVNERPGEREELDVDALVTWLEVLLDAGDEAVARRLSELSEDFVLRALTSIVRVLDHDALRDAIAGADEDEADAAEKAIEGGLSQEIDGYFLFARDARGWDAALAVILALDRENRALLERLLDRAARLSSRLLEDLDAFASVLTESETLAEDVEAEREERRAAQGFVEPRAARAFLDLARRSDDAGRDPITRAHFRALTPLPVLADAAMAALPGSGDSVTGNDAGLVGMKRRRATPAILEALQLLRASDPAIFTTRLDELTYLANVLVAGATGATGERVEAAAAAEAALATVAHGARLANDGDDAPTALCDALAREPADRLFRRASTALHAAGRPRAFVDSLDALVAPDASTPPAPPKAKAKAQDKPRGAARRPPRGAG